MSSTNLPSNPEPTVAASSAGEAATERARAQTYGQILKSSALIGGSSLVNIGLNSVRTMVMMVLLKPEGFGLLSIYQSIADLARSIAGVGLNSSGVRQIAEAVGTGDDERIARTVTTLRRLALFLGILGALLLVIFCQPIARLSFPDDPHAGAVALLALAVLFGAVSAGQMALVKGMRRIADLALSNVLGSIYGLVFSIPIVWYWGKRGVVPALVCVAIMGSVTSWWYSRKVKVRPVAMGLGDILHEAKGLLSLGLVFMVVGLMPTGMAYLVRLIVVHRIGLDAAGHYSAAWTFGGLYVGFILQAMGADFFPRLTAAAKDNRECNRLVNEQAEVSLLLAGPGVLGTLTFVPLAIELLFPKYGPTVEILRWICVGMMLRVASWPMGFILLAKGARQPYFWSELATCLVQVGLVWMCVLAFGLDGTGVAFFGGYVFYWVLIYAVVRSVSGFRWSRANISIGLTFGVLITAVFVGRYGLPGWAQLATGTTITVLAGVFSLKKLCTLVPLERLPRPAQRLIALLRLSPRGPVAGR